MTIHPEAYIAIRAAQNVSRWGEHAAYRYLDRHAPKNRLKAVLGLFRLAERLRKETAKEAPNAEIAADFRLSKVFGRTGRPYPSSLKRWLSGEPITPAVIEIGD